MARSKALRLKQVPVPKPVPQDRLVLGIDPGEHMGWALVHGQHVLDLGIARVPCPRGGLRASSCLDIVLALLRDKAPSLVAYEAMLLVRQSGYMGLARSRVPIEIACDALRLPWTQVWPSSWRAHFRLGQRQDKALSMSLAASLARSPIQSDDQAEAVLLALYASACVPTP